ncbi:MAG: hypothetical protein U1E14_05920 [Geminicoccaceae bacterium]
MGFDGGDLFDLVGARTRWLAGRHALISGNLANADTPGFVPLDAAPMDGTRLRPAGAGPGAVTLVRTSADHLAGTPRRQPDIASRPDKGWERDPAGNGVVVEEQVQKLAETQGQYRLATAVYGKYVRMLRTALGVAAG